MSANLRRALCVLLGHRRNSSLFRYVRPAGGRIVSQWPTKRGLVSFVLLCPRCLEPLP